MNTRKSNLLILVTSLSLAGCGTSITQGEQRNAPGQAAYSMEKTTPDGSTCKVWITSGRDVETGRVKIGPNCEVEAEADNLSGSEIQARMLEIIGTQAARIPIPLP